MDEYSDFFDPEKQDLDNTPSLSCIYGSNSQGFSMICILRKDGHCRVMKALKPEYRRDPVYESLLRKEFEIGINLNHYNICQTISFVNHPILGNCIEMDWIDGCNLETALKNNLLSGQEKRKIILQLCDAISYIHSKQVLHRDIKPSNILITYNGHNVKLIDFGLSDSDGHTLHKEPAGTRLYSAPELFSGNQPDCRSDIYSLGKVISKISTHFPGVVWRCCAQDPSRRFSNAEAVKKAISRQRLYFAIPVIALASLLILQMFQDADQADNIVRQASEIIRQSGL